MRSRLPFVLPEPDPATVELKARIDEALEAAIVELRAAVEAEAPEAVPLADELRTLVLGGGKRLRPILCVWGYRAGGGPDGDAIVRAAAALELVHTFAIVQDDLMDAASIRRGGPSLHVRLAEGERVETAAATALLVGDLAMIAADRLMAASGFPAERVVAASEPYNRMRLDAVAGQYLDVAGPSAGVADEEAALRVGTLKSGRYTVEGPLLVGAALAGDDAGVRAALQAYGRAAGRAFQVRDDVLGVFGPSELTGKDAGSDLRHGKPTVLVAKALRATSEAERRYLDARLGHADLTDGEIEQVRQIILSSGALDETLRLVARLLEEAKRAVDVLSIPAPARQGLKALADLLALPPALPPA